MEVPPPFINGEITAYGAGCKGSGQQAAGVIVPQAQATAMGDSQNIFPHGQPNMRYQQVFLSSEIPSPAALLGYELRQNDILIAHDAGTSTLTIQLGYTTKTHQTLTSSYAGNADQGPLTTVLNAGVISFPALSGVNTNPNQFAVKILFTTPFPFTPTTGQNLLIEIANVGSTIARSYWDAASSTTSARLYGTPATATTGTVALGYGLVMRLVTPGGSGAVPNLASNDTPVIGSPYSVNLTQARASTPAAILLGASDTKWLNLNLPLDFTAAGAPGCKLLASGEWMFPLMTSGSGTGGQTFGIPNDKSLIQVVVFHTTAILDPYNTLGLVFSNGLRVKVGGQP
jgi:hypothetical protein